MKHISHSKPTIDAKDAKVVADVIRSGQLAQGVKVAEFEKKLRRFICAHGAVATSSGTAALHLGLRSLGVGKGDEVIIPTYVCTALLNAVMYTGARPRLADVNEDDYNISIGDVAKKINKKTKAIIVPHMFGQPADINELLKFKIPLIEDCAQSVGALYKGKPVGSFGILSIFSFYATKILTTGEGGMVVSKNNALLRKVRDLRDYDNKNDYKVRFNCKMTDFQAALGIHQLRKLKTFIARRKKIAKIYNKELSDIGIELSLASRGQDHIYFRYIIKVKKNRTKLIKSLKKKGISCTSPVYKPLHRYLKMKGFPVADKLMKQAVSIPIYPLLRDKEIKYIISEIKENS